MEIIQAHPSMTKVEVQVSSTTTVIISKKGVRGYQVFTFYQDNSDAFVSYVKEFGQGEEVLAEQYFKSLVKKFSDKSSVNYQTAVSYK
jgi:hypothetical protein